MTCVECDPSYVLQNNTCSAHNMRGCVKAEISLEDVIECKVCD